MLRENRIRQLSVAAVVSLGLVTMSGCASFGRGVTEAVIDAQARESADRRECSVDGESFSGIAPGLADQQQFGAIGDTERPATKLFYVHGIGDHRPGHGGRLMRSLTSTLDLSVRAENFKRIELVPRSGPERPMGELTIVRMVDQPRERELLFFELTWSPITQPEKEAIEFDGSEIHTSQRAALNQRFRTFSNTALPDPLAFVGNRGGDIRDAVGQGLCWALSASWDDLPELTTDLRCEDSPLYGSRISIDELVIATHSLGSRATMDALQEAAQTSSDRDERQQQVARALQQEDITLYMLSNQLPLLESGQDAQPVTGQRDQFCGPTAPRADERFLKQLDLIAVTDPNDILSYPVPASWVDQYLDSRLCTRVRNVTINIAHVRNIPILGQFADPVTAHTGYVDDERVAHLMANGIGTDNTAPMIRERCSWTEVDPSLN